MFGMDVRLCIYTVGSALFSMAQTNDLCELYRRWFKLESAMLKVSELDDNNLVIAASIAREIVTDYYWYRVREILFNERISEN